MSTTAMWLLLAVVVIVIVFVSVLYKRTFTVHELALTGVMAALSLVDGEGALIQHTCKDDNDDDDCQQQPHCSC